MTVVLATHVGNALAVYLRNGDGAIAQVAQITASGDHDPRSLVALVSDLDLHFGWSGGSVAVGGGRPLPLEPAPAAPAPAPPKAKAKAKVKAKVNRISDQTAAARRARVEQAITAAGRPLSVGDLVEAGVIRRDEQRSGSIYSALDTMVRHGRLVREGDEGAYRWRLP